jgi:hypothetical protein
MTEHDSILAELIPTLDRLIQELGAIRTRAAEILAGKPAAPIDDQELDRRVRELAGRARSSSAKGAEGVICPICGAGSNSTRNPRRHLRRAHTTELTKPDWRGHIR